ncbi:MAG TPA: hypothetical protein VNS31_07155, partial [Ramlibacter sp.]|nr:hypothetical protein [Ramlibacter sp.]
MTHDCHSLVTGEVDVEPMGPRHLKGVPEPVEIFKLAGLKASRDTGAVYTRSAVCASGNARIRS